MRTIKNITLDDASDSSTAYLIQLLLIQCKYDTIDKQRMASEISKSLKMGEDVTLTDEQYALVKKCLDCHDAWKIGFSKLPFLELFN